MTRTSAMTMADTCTTCRYWAPNDEPQGIASDHGWGECRRYPPQVVQAEPGQRVACFPITTGEQWCGEYWIKGKPVPSAPA